jgi:hypothetical protein
MSRRMQDNPHRDERQRDRRNTVNVGYIRRPRDQSSGRYNSGHQINQDGRKFNSVGYGLNIWKIRNSTDKGGGFELRVTKLNEVTSLSAN